MTDGPGSQEILFIDDFNHSTIDLQWDHIKFDHSILVDQIRILPDNFSIQLSDRSEHRGGTTPSKFHVDFFSNNLHRTDTESSCLEKLGSLNYDENSRDTFMLKTPSIPTDWLVVAGSYKNLSIVVIGRKMQKSSPILAQLNQIPIVRSGIPNSVNGKFPSLIKHNQRHHPYAKPNQPIVKITKEENSEENKIETELAENSEIQEEMEDKSESSIVKFYLNLDECRDEKEILMTQISTTKMENLNSNFDMIKFRLEKKTKKNNPKLDGLNFDLIFLIENLNQSMLEYLPGFKNQIHQMLKSSDIKNHNLIFKLCKNLHHKYSKFLIDQVLDVSTLLVDLVSFYMQQGFYYQLFKLINWLNLTLNSAKSVENFVEKNYQRLVKQFESMTNMSSRLTSAVGRLLLKIQFNQNLNNLSSMCNNNFNLANLNSVKCVYESIVAYVQQNILTHNDSLLFPIEPIFSNKYSLNKEIFNFFDEKNFFKNILFIWSMNDNSFNCLIDRFMGDLFLPSAFNGHSFGPIEYLCNNAQLFNSIMDTCSHETSVMPNISYSVHLIDLFEQFMEQFNCVKKSRQEMEHFAAVNFVQEINFILNERAEFLTSFLSQPDGNFNNKYFRCLLEFFEYLIEDNLNSNLRCYAMNSITNILCTLCSTNLNWTVTAPKDYSLLKKLYKLSSHLFNNLIMTSLKPSSERNQSYFKLIDKLKLIISVLEPFYSYKDGDKNFLNYIIDSFREQIDKNMSQYLAKYVQNPTQALNYLNGNITQIVMLRNALKPCRQSDKLGKKIILGNLINRNLCHLLANFLSRLNDYVTFYRAKCDLKKSCKLAILIEPCVWLIKIIILNLFKVQQAKFDDFYVAEILLDMLPNLSHVFEQVQSTKADLFEVVAVYYKFKTKKTLDLISRFMLKKPENQACGLELFDMCLNTAPVLLNQLKSLFKENSHSYLIEENAPKGSTCARMVKIMCLSVELRPLFLSICKKLASKDFLKIFFDFLIELIGEIKLNFNLNEVESFRKQEIAPKEDYLYDVESTPFEETSHQFTQMNLNEYNIFLVKKFVFVTKFVIHFANEIDRKLLLDLFQSEPVISAGSLVSSSPIYSDFVPGLLRYFNQIDFNVKNSAAVHELCRIQEAILDLIYLFIDTLDQSFVAKILVDHLGMSRISHPQVDIKCLRCLIHLPNKQEIIKCHFNSLSYLINFINELAARINDLCFNEAVKIMNSFYVYMKVLIVTVMESGNRQKMWTLFNWSEKNSNDSLIDSISMSSSSLNGSLLHCIINLDKSLEILHSKLQDDECKKKFKTIINQSSSFIKYLNELDGKILAFFGETKLEAECVDELEQIVDLELEMDKLNEELLMHDKELFKKLRSNSEEVTFQCQPTEEFDEKVVKSKSPDMINTRTGIRYKAPMRGGHSNSNSRPIPSSTSVPVISHLGSQNSSLIRTDSFRSRPQNTSRPPSLHVDDFYRIEQQQKQLNNSTTDPPINITDSQLNHNNSADINYEELTVKTNDSFESKSFSSISPQVKNLNTLSVNMKSPLVTANQPNSTQYINQSLVKIQTVQNQYNLNQISQYNNNNDMSRFNYAGSHEMNSVYTGENISQLSPGQMHHQQIHPMQNQIYNNNFRFAPSMQNRGNNPAHSLHMMRGGLRRGNTFSNFNQLGQNQNFTNGNNYSRPPYH